MAILKPNILLTLFFPFFTSAQSKFVGEFDLLVNLSDTLDIPTPTGVYKKHFTINADGTYIYYEEEDPQGFNTSIRETFTGNWKSKGDIITFYNPDFREPKGIKFSYRENQAFTGIKVIVKDLNNEPLNVDWCSVDSLSPDKKSKEVYVNYKNFAANTINIQDPSYCTVYFRPHGHCAGFRDCDIGIHLSELKSGTLVEVICYSQDMEMKFRSKQYTLTGEILHEVSTSCSTPDAFTDNFIRTK